MQVISRAGIAWLEQHQLQIDDVILEAGTRRYISRRRLDLNPVNHTQHGSDWLESKNYGWRLDHRYGKFAYIERANGLAILNVSEVQLPDMICSKLAGSLERLIEIDPACMASKSRGQITSVANKRNGSIEIRLRIEWIDTSTLM